MQVVAGPWEILGGFEFGHAQKFSLKIEASSMVSADQPGSFASMLNYQVSAMGANIRHTGDSVVLSPRKQQGFGKKSIEKHQGVNALR